MSHGLIRFLNRHAQWRAIAPLLLLCAGYVWLFNFSSFPYAEPALISSGCGEGLLDVRPHYDAAQAYQALACYGTAGRALYKNFLLVDATFAFCYGMCFALLLTRLVRANLATGNAGGAEGVGSLWPWAGLLPLGIAATDGLENVLLYQLLSAYPDELPRAAWLAGYATSGKWVLSALTVAVLVGSVSRLWWRRSRV